MTNRIDVGHREVASTDVLEERERILDTSCWDIWDQWIGTQTPAEFLELCHAALHHDVWQQVGDAVESMNDRHHWVYTFNEDVVGDKLIQRINFYTDEIEAFDEVEGE
jgi:hypothetical protein